jgi:sugar O-acyltransferase (sialic acid O-acetyltransferase NeuD family)
VPCDGRKIFVAGTGSFALETVEYARDAGLEVTGLVELIDPERVGAEVHGLRVIALDEGAARNEVVVGAGGDRLGHWALLAEHGWAPASVVHPAAHLSPSAVVAPGAIVAPGAVVGAASRVGPHALVGRGALVGHHAGIGAGATLNPGANVAGNTVVGDGAVIGMGALVSNGIEIGAGAVVAAGAVVVRPVEPRTRVQGVPARVYTPG